MKYAKSKSKGGREDTPFRVCLGLILVLLLAPQALAWPNSPPSDQLAALRTIYSSLFGSAAPTTAPCGQWQVNGGIIVRCGAAHPYHVTEVKAPLASGPGSLPPEIGVLTALKKLQMMGVAEGTIPTEVGQLSQLTYLMFQTGTIGGTIPSHVVGLTNLRVFHINSLPNLEGTLPPGLLTSMTKLTHLFLHKLPQLHGTLPLGSDGLADIEEFRVSQIPMLEGAIPAMGAMSKVVRLTIEDTNLAGSIPCAIGSLNSLTNLKIAGNPSLQGTIPNMIFNSGSLIDVDFSRNPQLTGIVPTYLGTLTVISSFKANDCDLVGTLPADIGSALSAPYTLELSNNRLWGTVPASLSGFSTCVLHGNLFKNNALSPTCPIFPRRPLKGLDSDACGFHPC